MSDDRIGAPSADDVHNSTQRCTGYRSSRIAELTYLMRWAMTCATAFFRPSLEAAGDEARELGRELGRRFVHEDIPAGQQGGVDLQG